jgi:hypothetical protein
MRPSVPAVLVAALSLSLLACGAEPIGPTPVDQGIIVFMHSGFRGASQQLATDLSDLEKVQGPCGGDESESSRTWNDCISSVRVLPGWGATLYGDKHYRGATIEITEDLADLASRPGSCSGSYDDCISSIRVYRR